MTLIWKLLRQHLSIAQLAGFFFANLLGVLIVLLACSSTTTSYPLLPARTES